ncbi:MAG TPA: tetratricopeptide repeat protein [Micropepsaceae bacterium]|nr:tetratricopeptide repeat protein [Micropepsaceae bacterium]
MSPEHLRAKQFYESGRFDEAARQCSTILTRDPQDPEANHLIGLVFYRQGQSQAALPFLQRAVATGRGSARAFSNLGAVLSELGDLDQAISAYHRAIDLDPANPWPLNNLGVLYRTRGRLDAAIEAFRRALLIKPDLADAQVNLRLVYSMIVPQWHFAMLNDSARNDAYEAAIRRAVAGKRVLEIGTGAGLLAMMAARAGAASVDSCEAVGVIAREAAAIVAKNGFADRIKIIPKHSTAIVAGRDIPARADVLITETFSSNLLDEAILPSLEHAHSHLLTGQAVVIPKAAAAMGFLIGGEAVGGMLSAQRIKGFDLSTFNEFAPPRLVVPLHGIPFEALSADAELLRFELTQAEFRMGGREVALPVTGTGTCYGVALWIRLDLDDDIRFSNRPGESGGSSHWPNIIYRFPNPLSVTTGQALRVFARHDRAEINIDLLTP